MKKDELKTLQVAGTAKKGKEYLKATVRLTIELKQEGIEAAYNAMGKLVERNFERIVDSKWLGADLVDNNISSDEITICDAARQLRTVAEWAKTQADILCPEEENTTENNEEVAK